MQRFPMKSGIFAFLRITDKEVRNADKRVGNLLYLCHRNRKRKQ